MHGRVKVRTTVEQEAIKNAERTRKVKEYRAVMSTLVTKRKDKNWDQDYLEAISKMLLKNPDMTTLWNMRREVFETMDPKSEDYLQQLAYELTLTEQCLKENPKSYCIWHHRCWVVEHLPEPDWKRELELCKLCLNKDERNFHCWDYRKFIVNKANVSDEEELKFSTSKILKNFSNYSSWHYRSKILSKMFPDNKNNLPIREEKHKEELDLVMNATFTDPYDSSAWFYQRWLLEPRLFSGITVCKIQIDKKFASISFNKEVDMSRISLFINDIEINWNWKSTNEKRFSKFYLAEFIEPMHNFFSLDILNFKFENDVYPLMKMESKDVWIYNGKPIVSDGYNTEQLLEQLENYRQLSEMEPDNKWSLLTSIFLMKNIDFVKYYTNILKDLNTLMNVDSLRLNYYKDLRSKYILEYILVYESETTNYTTLDLSNLNLTTIYYEQYLNTYEEVNLSDNHLHRSMHLLYCLQNCTTLSLKNNGIKSLKSLARLRKLKKLSLENNEISDIEEVLCLVKKQQLEEINLRSNPVCQTDVVNSVKEICSNTTIIVE